MNKMKKSDTSLFAGMALASIGIGSLIYSYMQMHPAKCKAIANDMKNMMKDWVASLLSGRNSTSFANRIR